MNQNKKFIKKYLKTITYHLPLLMKKNLIIKINLLLLNQEKKKIREEIKRKMNIQIKQICFKKLVEAKKFITQN